MCSFDKKLKIYAHILIDSNQTRKIIIDQNKGETAWADCLKLYSVLSYIYIYMLYPLCNCVSSFVFTIIKRKEYEIYIFLLNPSKIGTNIDITLLFICTNQSFHFHLNIKFLKIISRCLLILSL